MGRNFQPQNAWIHAKKESLNPEVWTDSKLSKVKPNDLALETIGYKKQIQNLDYFGKKWWNLRKTFFKIPYLIIR